MDQRDHLEQVSGSEERATRCDQNERIDRDHIGPGSRQSDQSLFLVVEVDAFIAPRILIGDQLERAAAPRMERMGDSECLRRNVRLRRSCQRKPRDVWNAAF